ncbi:sugar phosphate isomerase/epimerase and 4-hydroxyphenylpyruvate domain-containing protein [Alphaproteobacteria bacterium]|nr:sugar phosphate isomerase/epimerase and 4-hydroxyphenylpyruvate domain-containing protein [Alphaproteobacteria bacterium]
MKTSIATVSINGTLKQKIQAIAKAGFEGVEIFENDFLTNNMSPKEIKKLVKDNGLEITLFQPFRDFEGMPDQHRTRAFERAKKKFDVMEELETDLILICSNTSNISLSGIDRAANDFYELGEIAKKRQIKIGYEALAWGKYINDHRDAWEIVRRASHDNVGIILDSFHTLSKNIDLNSISLIPAEKIFIVQLADAPFHKMDLLYWSRHFRNMPGQGDLPISNFMNALNKTGYDGYLSLEIFNDSYRSGPREQIAKDGKRSLISLMTKDNLKEKKVEISNIEFIEFATEEKDLVTLENLFKTMGFKEIGKHKTKLIKLFTFDDVKIIINYENSPLVKEGRKQGPYPYAYGIKIKDTDILYKRSKLLDIEVIKRENNNIDLSMDVIKNIDGLIYIMDSTTENIWEEDFGLRSSTNTNIFNLKIDHIAQTVHYDQMSSALLSYTTLFNCQKSSIVDIIDPSGITKSQIIENKTQSFRITMNGTDNRNTLAGKFLENKKGPGIQHIAIRTADIIKLVQTLKDHGQKFLEISNNYYDDIEARFGLNFNFCKELEDLNILYDEDENGSFLQIYTHVFNDQFFFEFVERINNYKGYGANNALFRIAAQNNKFKIKSLQ